MEPVNVGDLVVAKIDRRFAVLQTKTKYQVLDIRHVGNERQYLISWPGARKQWWMAASCFTLFSRHSPTDAGAAEYEEIMAIQEEQGSRPR